MTNLFWDIWLSLTLVHSRTSFPSVGEKTPILTVACPYPSILTLPFPENQLFEDSFEKISHKNANISYTVFL